MNTPNAGPIIEVTNQPSEIGGQNETRAPRETKTAPHPFGSVLLRLELALSLICVRRTRGCPAEARTRVRPMGWIALQRRTPISNESLRGWPRQN